MQPSSDSFDEPERNPLRRYGPIVGVLVVIALIVVGAVVLKGGGDDDTATGKDTKVASGFPKGTVTWEMAKADKSLDAKFPDTCDPKTGKVAIPFFFAPTCTAIAQPDPNFKAQGVTKDSIDVVLWLPNEDDVIFAFIKQALGFDDTVDEIKETQLGLVEIFQKYYNTYGRKVNVHFVQASGSMLDSVAARADAVKAASYHPAAVLGGPLLAGTWTEELHNRGITCIACPGISDSDPIRPGAGASFGLLPSDKQLREHVVNYVTAKLAGKKAQFGGDDVNGKKRVFGHLKLASNDHDKEDADKLRKALQKKGVDIVKHFTFQLSLGGGAEFATGAVTQMKDAGVTTVLVDGDPITLGDITREATKQNWFPEWVMTAPSLLDTNAGAHLVDPKQWQHAFGISFLPPASTPKISPAYILYKWYFGKPPPAEGSLLLTYPQIALFFTAIHLAGPDPSPDNLRRAAFAFPPTPRARTQPSVNYGTELWGGKTDYAGIDDLVELWFDPKAVGIDELGHKTTGVYRYVDGAKRFYANEWTSDLKVFDPKGSITSLTEPPPEERPHEYPSPAKSNGG